MDAVVQELGREGVLPLSKIWASNWPFHSPAAGLLEHYLVSVIIMLAPPPGDAYNFLVKYVISTDTRKIITDQLSQPHLLPPCNCQLLRRRWPRSHLPHQREKLPELEAWSPCHPTRHHLLHAVEPVPRSCAICAAQRGPECVRTATILPTLCGSPGTFRSRRNLLHCLGCVVASIWRVCARQGVRRGCRWMVSQCFYETATGRGSAFLRDTVR